MSLTTKELISRWYDFEEELSLDSAPTIEKEKEFEKLKADLLNNILNKVDNIDAFTIKIDEDIAQYSAIKAVHQKEIDRLRNRIAQSTKFKKYLNSVLIPALIDVAGKDGKLSTSSANYTVFTGWGKILFDKTKIDTEKYISIEEVEKINTRLLKTDAIQAQKDGKPMDGVTVMEEKRIRRS